MVVAVDTIGAIASYSLALLTLAIVGIPLAIVAWRLIRPSRRDQSVARFFFVPIAFLVLLVLLIQGVDALGGGELLTGLIYLLAGAGR
jgi:hypothetical protein